MIPFIAALLFISGLITPVLSADDLYFEKRDFSSLTIPSVSCITEDDRGFIWVGTPGGLVRYESRKSLLINRQNYPDLPSDQILSLDFDKDSKNLWVGTAAGLVRFNLPDDRMEQPTLLNTNKQTVHLEIIDIAIPGSGKVFAVTGNNIYRLLDDNIMDLVPVEPAAEGNTAEIFGIAAAEDGVLWAAASDGLKSWDGDNERFIHVLKIADLRRITVIGHEIWAGSENGSIHRYNSDTGQLQLYSVPGETTAIKSGPEGLIWVGSEINGLSVIDPVTAEVRYCEVDPEHPYKLPSNRIESLFSGSSGQLWIGTPDSGLLSVDVRKKNHLEYIERSGTNGLPIGSVEVIFEDSLGYIWVGSNIGGLARLDPLNGELKKYTHDPGDSFSIPNDHISSIVEDNSGRLWIGTHHGPAFYLPEIDGFEPAGVMISGWPDFRGKHVLTISKAYNGYIWISFRNGELYRLNSQERRYTVQRFSSSSAPTVLFIDSQGTLMAGSRENLRLFNSDGKLLKTWFPVGVENDGIQKGGITTIFSDSHSRIWLGSPTGLAVYRGFNDGFEEIVFPDQISLNVSEISEDTRGNLWLSDGHQVYIYNSETGFLYIMGDDVGLTPSGLITNLTRKRNGTMFVGANGEIWNYDSVVHSYSFKHPRVFLTELSIMNEITRSGYELDNPDPVKLSPEEKVFSISFEALDYRYRSDIRYQYRLAGFNDVWVDNEKTDSVTFANLPPGVYQFFVRAINELGDFSDNTASISITVEKSYWLRTPAIIMYIAVFFAAFILFLKIWEGHLMKAQIFELEKARLKVIEANKQLSFLTMNDTLTGLLNRRGFDRGISLALGTAQRNNLMITLYMIDVDFFKLFNDNYGHVQGDEVLRSVGKALSMVFGRSTDIIARYGGEEFAVVFVGENPNASVTLANDLIMAIEELMISHEYSSVSSLLTLSAGSATIRAGENDTVLQLIVLADKAMYMAKNKGRNRICYTGIIPELPVAMKNGLKPVVINEETH